MNTKAKTLTATHNGITLTRTTKADYRFVAVTVHPLSGVLMAVKWSATAEGAVTATLWYTDESRVTRDTEGNVDMPSWWKAQTKVPITVIPVNA